MARMTPETRTRVEGFKAVKVKHPRLDEVDQQITQAIDEHAGYTHLLEAVWKQSLYERRPYVICGARLRTDLLDNRSLAMLLEISKGLIY